MKKVLIIGGLGFIGLHLAKRLQELNYYIVILDKNEEKLNNLNFLNNIEFIEGDIKDSDLINRLVLDKDYVINFAALISNQKVDGIGKESLIVNCLGELKVLEAIRKFNPNCLHLFMGSKSQFGKENFNGEIIDENKKQNPFSFYGIHKQTCENYLNYYKKIYNLKICSLRVMGVYGLDFNKSPKGIVAYFVVNCLNNKKIKINEGGNQINDFIYIEDLIDLFIKIIERNIEGIYNVGSGEGLSIKKIWDKVKNICNNKNAEDLVIHHNFSKEEDLFELGYYVSDISKIKKISNWQPKVSIEEGIKRIKEIYLNKNKNNINI